MICIHKELAISSRYYIDVLSYLRLPNKKQSDSARLVGGAVRDALLSKATKDIDITTILLPETVLDILTKKGLHVIPTGLKFGTVMAILRGETFEITTLRKDLECDGRHAKVVYGTDFVEDANRRDFTINALSYCPFEQSVYDYFNGLNDLENKRVVFIGEAEKRIQEDFLRILRFFRFSAFYAKELDAEGLEACKNNIYGLKKLSRERIQAEMNRLLLAGNSANILEEMFKVGILAAILPISSFTKEYHERLKLFEQMTAYNCSVLVKYALLLKDNPIPPVNDLVLLRFSKQAAMKVVRILEFLQNLTPATYNTLLNSLWFLCNTDYKDYIAAAVATEKMSIDNAGSFISQYDKRSLPIFPIKGGDLMKGGIKGKDIGYAMQKARDIWFDSNFTLDKQALINLVTKNVLQQQ